MWLMRVGVLDGDRVSFQSMLQVAHRDADSRVYDDVYAGVVRLDSIGVSLPPEVRVLEMTAPYPRLSVDVLVEVLTPEGFICQDADSELAELRLLWQANDMDTTVKLAMTEALVRGVSYLSVSRRDNNRVVVQGLPPDSATVEYDAAGDVTEGIWMFRAPSGHESAIYYAPGESVLMEYRFGEWRVAGRVETHCDVPALVPMTNRSRLGGWRGISELDQIIAINDGASRSLTNLQVAQELLAMPLRAAFNDKMAADVNTMNAGQRRKFKLDSAMGGFLVAPRDTELKQLPGADLNPIISSVKLYAQMVSAMTGIPPSMLGLTTDNPASAEAMRAAKERLITRAESKQVVFGDALEQAALVMLQMSGVDTEGMETLECVWRDPATPSVAAKAAHALQAQAQGVISNETAREFLNLTPEQKQRENANTADLSGLRTVGELEAKRLANLREATLGGTPDGASLRGDG